MICNEIYNYTDNTTIHSSDFEVENVITRLETDASQLTTWFQENNMKLNEDKRHLIFYGANQEGVDIHIEEAQIEESDGMI